MVALRPPMTQSVFPSKLISKSSQLVSKAPARVGIFHRTFPSYPLIPIKVPIHGYVLPIEMFKRNVSFKKTSHIIRDLHFKTKP